MDGRILLQNFQKSSQAALSTLQRREKVLKRFHFRSKDEVEPFIAYHIQSDPPREFRIRPSLHGFLVSEWDAVSQVEGPLPLPFRGQRDFLGPFPSLREAMEAVVEGVLASWHINGPEVYEPPDYNLADLREERRNR